MFDVYLITADEAPERVLESVVRALGDAAWAGRVALQYRAKDRPPDEVRRVAHALRQITRDAGVALLVNSWIEIAHEVSADGVHLPEQGPAIAEARARLGASALVGVSCHDARGLLRADAQGATFASVSPVFATPGKGAPLGPDGFRALVHGARLPVFALGGICCADAPALARAGARGVAVIRAVMQARAPAQALAEMVAAVQATRGENLDTVGRGGGR